MQNNYLIISGKTNNSNEIVSERLSGTLDTIPTDVDLPPNTYLTISGSLETLNTPDRHVKLYIHVDELLPYEPNLNSVELVGRICKTPTYRQTPKGKTITNLLVAVSEANEVSNTNKMSNTNFVPIIYWGDATNLLVGTTIAITGRIQSRTYKNGTKTTYEVSAKTLTPNYLKPYN